MYKCYARVFAINQVPVFSALTCYSVFTGDNMATRARVFIIRA